MAIRERGGYALMPEWDTQPANQYLPRRVTETSTAAAARAAANESGVLGGGVHHARRRGAGPGGRAGAGRAGRRCRSRRGFVGTALLLAVAHAAGRGLGASFVHLGRPERAWRAVLMWRTSWLSREVIVLPAFIAVVGAVVAGASHRLAHGARRAAARWHRARGAAVVLHRDDLRLPALHPGVGAAADARQLRADRLASGLVLLRALARLRRRTRCCERPAPCALRGHAARRGPRASLALRRNARLQPQVDAAIGHRHRRRRGWCRRRWACRPARSTRASSSMAARRRC